MQDIARPGNISVYGSGNPPCFPACTLLANSIPSVWAAWRDCFQGWVMLPMEGSVREKPGDPRNHVSAGGEDRPAFPSH